MLEAYEYDGKLYRLAPSFPIYTVSGKTAGGGGGVSGNSPANSNRLINSSESKLHSPGIGENGGGGDAARMDTGGVETGYGCKAGRDSNLFIGLIK